MKKEFIIASISGVSLLLAGLHVADELTDHKYSCDAARYMNKSVQTDTPASRAYKQLYKDDYDRVKQRYQNMEEAICIMK